MDKMTVPHTIAGGYYSAMFGVSVELCWREAGLVVELAHSLHVGQAFFSAIPSSDIACLPSH